MGASIMIVCQEDNNWLHNRDYATKGQDMEHAFFLEETDHDLAAFTEWFQERYSGFPDVGQIVSALSGSKAWNVHDWKVLTEADYVAVDFAVRHMQKPEGWDEVKITEFLDYIKRHVGLHISTEAW